MIVSGFRPLTGAQCESTTCRNLLASEGLELSEPMVFGLGSGLDFNYMERYDRKTDLREPMVFCTAIPGRMAKNLGEALGPKLIIEETVSRSQARENLLRRLDSGKPYGLKLDGYYLEYVERKAHFNAYFVTACGYDDTNLYLVDVGSSEIRKSSLCGIEQARSAKGFLASKNMGIYYDWRPLVPFEHALKVALSKTVMEMLYDQSSFRGVKGIEKFGERVRGWRKNPNFKYQLINHYLAWEGEAGGRGGFRKLYADFLEEASIVLNNPRLGAAGEALRSVASDWAGIDGRLRQMCTEQDGLSSGLNEVSKVIKRQAKLEAEAFRLIEAAIC